MSSHNGYGRHEDHVPFVGKKDPVEEDLVNCGYHLTPIIKGTLGEFSKIKEELAEAEDAIAQNCKIMELVELSDLIGAIEMYVEKKFNMSLDDLKTMSAITKRAFQSGAR